MQQIDSRRCRQKTSERLLERDHPLSLLVPGRGGGDVLKVDVDPVDAVGRDPGGELSRGRGGILVSG